MKILYFLYHFDRFFILKIPLDINIIIWNISVYMLSQDPNTIKYIKYLVEPQMKTKIIVQAIKSVKRIKQEINKKSQQTQQFITIKPHHF